jgi:hypothetical protein
LNRNITSTKNGSNQKHKFKQKQTTREKAMSYADISELPMKKKFIKTLHSVFGSVELKTFVAIYAIQYITFWFFANVQMPGQNSLTHSTVPPPPPSSLPPHMPSNTYQAVGVILTNSVLRQYVLRIFETNTVIMLLETIPFFGAVYGEYIMVKLGLVVNYAAISWNASHSLQITSLLLSGLLLSNPFFFLETAGLALGCSAGLACVPTRFKPLRRRLGWILAAAALSAVLLFLAAVLEASLILG